MPIRAHLNASRLSDTCTQGQITLDEGEASLLPNEMPKALLAKAKKPQINLHSPKSQRLKVDVLLGTPRASTKLKLEKPGGSDISQEAGWICLQADAAKTGLHTQGRWQADVEIATNLARVLLAQILPTRIEISPKESDAGAIRAVAQENVWIDILLHQMSSANSSLCALSMLELAAYRLVNGEVKLIKSVKSSPMPMEMLSVFTLGYRLKSCKITIDICSDLDRLTTSNIDIEGFGETLPIVKLRSGRALPNGIFRAKYRQIVSWSA